MLRVILLLHRQLELQEVTSLPTSGWKVRHLLLAVPNK